ncbi:MAG: hypothetical protein AAFX76_06200, partial [Planctomycetota bacterium]
YEKHKDDDGFVYVAATVREPTYTSNAGQPATVRKRLGKGKFEVVETPHTLGVPGGLTHVANTGDVLQLAFGFRDRVPGYGRQMDDVMAWRGDFYDTDYQYNVHSISGEPVVMRQWGPDTDRRNGYQVDDVPHIEPVAGAEVEIERDEAAGITTYELAIPRSELTLFDPGELSVRFAFMFRENDTRGRLQWAEAAGVFDHWLNYGTFAPTWAMSYPCQTFFGIEP